MKHLRKLSCLLLFAVLLLFPPNGSSCGPFFPDVVFTYQKRPGAPLKAYAEGQLGIVLPSFTPSYLVIAYRYLAGRPLSPGERDEAIRYWRWSYQNPWLERRSPQSPSEEWLAARNRILGVGLTAPEIDTYRLIDAAAYSGYENCLADSFHTATLTLNDRVRRFGSDRAAVLEWIKGQDVVFSDCNADRAIPGPLPATSPAWLRADRNYQLGAALFYSHSFDQAAQVFDEIRIDPNSPWRGIAPYLAARAMIRKGMILDTRDEDALHNAEARLTRIVTDPAASHMHPAARHMLAYIALRIRPRARNAELARLLAGPQPDRDFKQDLIDYNWSLAHLTGDQPSGTPQGDKTRQEGRQGNWRALAQARAANEMADWLMTFSEAAPDSRDHAIERWRKLRSLPWLVAALAKIDAKDRAAVELLRAAEEVPAASPAYATILHHRVRLLIEAGESGKARALLEEFLSSPPPQLTVSSLNLFLAQRVRLAASFHDFLVHAPRRVVDVDLGDGYFESCDAKTCNELFYGGAAKDKDKLRLDSDVALILNVRVPLELQAQAALGEELPEPLRGEAAVAAWTRAVMLERQDIAATLVPEMEKAYPVMKERLERYLAAKPEEKKRAALFVILHFPGMRPYVNAGAARGDKMENIDNYRDNWWCGDMGAMADDVSWVKDQRLWYEGRSLGVPKNAPGPPEFLSAEQSKSAASEWKAISALGAGSSYLTRQTLAWAQERPHDANIPEALHLAVRSTRYGCADAKFSGLSHKAFQLLHQRYPNSKWAKETPYWF